MALVSGERSKELLNNQISSLYELQCATPLPNVQSAVSVVCIVVTVTFVVLVVVVVVVVVVERMAANVCMYVLDCGVAINARLNQGGVSYGVYRGYVYHSSNPPKKFIICDSS